MEPRDPRGLTGHELERRLRQEGVVRFGAELRVLREPGGKWSAQFVSHRRKVGIGRRDALEKLWVSLGDDLPDR
jgi:hypothetical protein